MDLPKLYSTVSDFRRDNKSQEFENYLIDVRKNSIVSGKYDINMINIISSTLRDLKISNGGYLIVGNQKSSTQIMEDFLEKIFELIQNKK